jgi:hypothetical protein
MLCHEINKDTMNKIKIRGKIADVLARNAPDLMTIPGVVGVYEGEDDDQLPCVRVMVLSNSDELQKKLPRTLEGFAVVMEITGEIKPL